MTTTSSTSTPRIHAFKYYPVAPAVGWIRVVLDLDNKYDAVLTSVS